MKEVGHLVIDLEWFLIVEQIEIEQVANHLIECNTNNYPRGRAAAGRPAESAWIVAARLDMIGSCSFSSTGGRGPLVAGVYRPVEALTIRRS